MALPETRQHTLLLGTRAWVEHRHLRASSKAV